METPCAGSVKRARQGFRIVEEGQRSRTWIKKKRRGKFPAASAKVDYSEVPTGCLGFGVVVPLEGGTEPIGGSLGMGCGFVGISTLFEVLPLPHPLSVLTPTRMTAAIHFFMQRSPERRNAWNQLVIDDEFTCPSAIPDSAWNAYQSATAGFRFAVPAGRIVRTEASPKAKFTIPPMWLLLNIL